MSGLSRTRVNVLSFHFSTIVGIVVKYSVQTVTQKLLIVDQDSGQLKCVMYVIRY